jgi:hypothetical protein
LFLGLELLVAADIVKTIAIELTFTSLGLLAGLMLVRTFLSWTLVLEIEGRWPWARELIAPRNHASVREVARTKRPEGGSGNICTRMRVPRSAVAFADSVSETLCAFPFWV